MAHQLVHLFERAFVEQQVDAFARGKFPFLMLARAAFFASTGLGRGMRRRNSSIRSDIQELG